MCATNLWWCGKLFIHPLQGGQEEEEEGEGEREGGGIDNTAMGEEEEGRGEEEEGRGEEEEGRGEEEGGEGRREDGGDKTPTAEGISNITIHKHCQLHTRNIGGIITLLQLGLNDYDCVMINLWLC